MSKIRKIIRTIHHATRAYDVPAEHAFSRESIAEQTAIGTAELAKAERNRPAPAEIEPFAGTPAV